MSDKMKAMVAALVTALVIFYLGTTYFYMPIRESTAESAAAIGSPLIALLIVSILMVVFLAWVYDCVGEGAKSGLIIGISQLLLVDVYYPMLGERSWAGAAASAVLLVAGWWVIGTVYGKLIGGAKAA